MSDPFIAELSKRSVCVSRPLNRPSWMPHGHAWMTIQLDKCDNKFIERLEEFLAHNKDLFEVHIRGIDFYVELLTCDSPEEAFSKAKF